jgi:hypothetical protein
MEIVATPLLNPGNGFGLKQQHRMARKEKPTVETVGLKTFVLY